MPLQALAGLALFAAVFAFSRRAGENRRIMAVGALALCLRALFCVIWPIAPADDFLVYYRSAQGLAALPLSEWAGASLGEYVDGSFGYMAPFVKYEALALKFLPGGAAALMAVNALASAATAMLACAVADRLCGARAGLMAGLAMALDPFVLFFMSALTNQHLATFLMMSSVAFIALSPFKNKWLDRSLAGLLLALSNIMRPEAVIVLIAIFCARLVWLVRKRCKARDALPDIALAAVYLLMTGLFASGGMNLGYKLLVGLNQETAGMWNPGDAAVLQNAPETIHTLIKERLVSIPDVIMLMLEKTCRVFLWYGNTFADIQTAGGVIRAYPSFVSGYHWGVIAAALLASFKKRRAPEFAVALMGFMLFGFIAAYALIETQQRYSYVTLPLFAVFASGAATTRPRRGGV